MIAFYDTPNLPYRKCPLSCIVSHILHPYIEIPKNIPQMTCFTLILYHNQRFRSYLFFLKILFPRKVPDVRKLLFGEFQNSHVSRSGIVIF